VTAPLSSRAFNCHPEPVEGSPNQNQLQKATMPEPLTKEEVLAKLEKGESLRGVEIGDVDFSGHSFDREPNFTKAIFTGKANFQEARFLSGAKFVETQFSSEANFYKTIFSGNEEANFDDAHFHGNGRADFRRANFSNHGATSFVSTEFSCEGGADFSRAKFDSPVRTFFHEAKFSGNGRANFRSAQFSGLGGVSFWNSCFSSDKGVTFNFATFTGKKGADFSSTQFSGQGLIDFSNTEFSGNLGVDFSEAHFSCKKGTRFIKTKFLGPGIINFDKTVFEESIPVWFLNIEMDFPENLKFIDVSNLGNVLFLYSDLEKISFKNARFRKTQNKLFNREYLADEIRNEIVTEDNDKIEYSLDYFNQVEILYRQLKLNFENQRDYARAGDFHYGELEMRRKAKMLEWEEKPVSKYLPFLKYFNLTQFYKIVSGYGEKWVQALASFVAVWLMFTGLNLFWVEPKSTMPQEQPARMEQWKKDSIHRLGGSALFSFKVLTLQRWGDDFQLKGTSYFPKFFVALQHLIGPTIIALMLLAIRRQFRR
jgi:hypothetical protein